MAIEVVDPATGLLMPLTARGVHAGGLPASRGRRARPGVATWVVEHNEPVYISDERTDPRVNHFRGDVGPVDGSLIVVPLRGRGGAIGVLTIERLGARQRRSRAEEFELVQLFAAQVSIALQNAEVFQAVEIRARTDDLTGLLNHGDVPGVARPARPRGAPFSLIMLDLDDFRDVNNDLGHQAGDEMLRRIAAELVRAGRDTDLVFRYGGDEFTFLLPNTDEAGALHVAERARKAVPRHGRRDHRLGRGGDLPAGRRRPPRTSCLPPTAPATWPSAAVATASRPPPRASPWRPSCPSRSRRRSTRPGDGSAAG